MMGIKAIVVVIAIIFLVIFFFPKEASEVRPEENFPNITQIDYTCIGFEKRVVVDIFVRDHNIFGQISSPAEERNVPHGRICFGFVLPFKKCYTALPIYSTLSEIPSCKSPNTWEEILKICHSVPHCYILGARIAYKQYDLSKAFEVCSSAKNLSEELLMGEPADKFKYACIMRVLYDIGNNPQEAKKVCQDYVAYAPYTDTCFEMAAIELAKYDIEKGAEFCGYMQNTTVRDRCYYHIASSGKDADKSRRLEICDMIEGLDDEYVTSSTCRNSIY